MQILLVWEFQNKKIHTPIIILKIPTHTLIYEVVRSEGKFCVVSYKSQHKVCFRFFDGEYQQTLFVSENGNVPDSWEGIAHQLDLNKIFIRKEKSMNIKNIEIFFMEIMTVKRMN